MALPGLRRQTGIVCEQNVKLRLIIRTEPPKRAYYLVYKTRNSNENTPSKFYCCNKSLRRVTIKIK